MKRKFSSESKAVTEKRSVNAGKGILSVKKIFNKTEKQNQMELINWEESQWKFQEIK